MTPLDSALLRLGRVTLSLLHPRLSERAAAKLGEDEEDWVAADVGRLADLLTR